MIASAASRLAAAGVAGVLLLSNPVTAQAPGQPRQLFPQGGSTTAPTPQSGPQEFRAPLLQEEGAGQGREAEMGEPWREQSDSLTGLGEGLPEEVEPHAQQILRGGILVDALEGGLPETSGILEAREGGLGLDLWQGSDRDELIRLIRVLPDNLESPALRDLARRLLLSTATPPRGGAGSAAPGELLRARAERLYALGAHEELLELLQRLPREAREDPALARLHVEVALLTRQRAEACRVTAAGIDDFNNDAFWQEALIYCQIREGQEAAANLGLSLLRETGEGDPQLLQLAEAALGYRDVVQPRDANALILAYLDALDEPPSSGLIEQAPYAFLGVLAQQLTLSFDERLPLVERAVQFGLLEPRKLAEAYERHRFNVQQLGDPAAAARESDGSAARALLYKGAWRAGSAAEKLELLQAFLEHSAAEDLSLAALQVASDLVLDIHPDGALAPHAPLIVRALLTTGRLEQAAAWTSLLRSSREKNQEAGAAYAEVWPLARVAGIEADGALTLNAWEELRSEALDAGHLAEEKAFLQLLIDALEGREAGRTSASLSRIGGAAPPSPSVVYALQSAAAAGRRGETALLVLQLLGSGALTDEHPRALAESLSALADVGLRATARAIAVESLLVLRN
ncbi:MAG TPA: hypothetical protein VKY54_02980 [Kiloniellales bacterium]|nr:hypothetical protein [Kiloniellales bacterium]